MSLLTILSVAIAKRHRGWHAVGSLLTLYPLYSIFKGSSLVNPRPTRTLLYWMTIASMAFFIAVFFAWIKPRAHWRLDIIWGTLVGLVFSWIMNYIIGFVHYCFIRRRGDRAAPKVVDKITLLVIIVFFVVAMIAVIDMETNRSAEVWAGTLALAWVLDNFIFDVIVAFFAITKCVRAWVKIRGFYLDADERVPNV